MTKTLKEIKTPMAEMACDYLKRLRACQLERDNALGLLKLMRNWGPMTASDKAGFERGIDAMLALERTK